MGSMTTRRHCIAGLLGATALGGARRVGAQTPREVTIGLSSASLGTAGLRIAQELGLFAARGLSPRFVVMDSANATITALVSKSLDVAISGPTELIAAQARGQHVVAIGTTYGGFAPCAVIAKTLADKLGIGPTSQLSERMKALDGVVFGSPSTTSVVTVAMRGAAKAVGATVRFAFMGQPAMVAGLESGAIQGYGASAPFWALPVLKGSGVLLISGPKGEFPAESTPAITGQLQTMRAFAEANPNLIRTLADILADLGHAIEARPGTVKAAMAKLYPDLDAKAVDLLFDTEALGWSARQATVSDMAREIAFVKASGAQIAGFETLNPAAMLYP
jgi:ABC-type nitrate/sulfonate/bicarbonate transport system substrate-binding protein